MRIRITAGGIYDGKGAEIPVGSEIDVADFEVDGEGQPVSPHPWGGRFIAIGESKKGKKGVTNDGALKAEHHGGGKFKITQGEETLLSDLSKADADAFNALSDEDKAAFVADQKKA
jgi:hypothetical protein